MTTGGPTPTTTTVRDVYQAGRIAYQTDGAGTTLATFSYNAGGSPTSVQVGNDPATAPRYYYVYNAHGDVVALVDTSGAVVASYSYDVFGALQPGSSESFPGGWSNPYRYDGIDRVRYDSETGLYWMSVRAYEPTLGRFISRDPLNRQAQASTSQPYVYGANNPLANVDPSGQRIWQSGMTESQSDYAAALLVAHTHITTQPGKPAKPQTGNPCSRQNYYAGCGDWRERQRDIRDGHVGEQMTIPGIKIILGSLIVILADVELERLATGWKEKALTILDIAATFVDDLAPYFAYVARNNQAVTSTVMEFSAIVHGFTSLVHQVMTLYDSAGWFMQSILDAASSGLMMAVSGVPGIVTDLAFKLGLSAFLHGAASLGHAEIADGMHSLSPLVAQNAMDIGDWCAQYGVGVCETPPAPPV